MTRCALASAFLLSALSLALLGLTESAAAKPTEAQLSAIKSNCRSDFMSNCWGVPRGGAEAFQCLKEHMASLSPGCAQAVKAVSPPAPAPAPKKTETAPPPAVEPAPAPAAAEAEPTAATEPPPPAAEAKATAPAAAPAPAPKPASETPKAEAKAPPPPQASEPPPAAPKAAEPKAADAAPAPPIIGFIPPRKKLMVLRNCRQDLETYCAGVDYGDGRQLHCLFSNKASLTPDCQGALAKLAN